MATNLFWLFLLQPRPADSKTVTFGDWKVPMDRYYETMQCLLQWICNQEFSMNSKMTPNNASKAKSQLGIEIATSIYLLDAMHNLCLLLEH